MAIGTRCYSVGGINYAVTLDFYLMDEDCVLTAASPGGGSTTTYSLQGFLISLEDNFSTESTNIAIWDHEGAVKIPHTWDQEFSLSMAVSKKPFSVAKNNGLMYLVPDLRDNGDLAHWLVKVTLVMRDPAVSTPNDTQIFWARLTDFKHRITKGEDIVDATLSYAQVFDTNVLQTGYTVIDYN